MIPDDQAPVPALVPAFDLFIERGPAMVVGQLAAGGRRVHVAVQGGTAAGAELRGVLVGGSEALLERGNGVAVIEANYLIRADDGSIARAFGHGFRTDGGDFTGIRLSLLFEADERGRLAHLVRRVYVAEKRPGDVRLAVMRID